MTNYGIPDVHAPNAGESPPVTFRLDENLRTQLEALAIMDGDNLASQVRKAAVVGYEVRRADPNFPNEVEAARARMNNLFDDLLAK